ncbi:MULTISPECIES: succinate dehydrogenase, cytochrome b556 subunit [Rubrivivax]|uniref:Succinate dehydrogenase cytochrome b556 subunit n=1 Tax=Rubrivivax benzoatilyticus TaxID=316997 RepID=A0ABX0HQJ0_9BURK|nr:MULTISPECIES: succinate dehydrogenase, cytochrome b556 subunit [Rubrivivax]MCD0418922.1 succinate dehydrogenase, cytochrome b556 subunit [Rubrivivax sp. JA1024]EGJ10632.1 succinate dehydrogenase, cytochrome b556 subunit [Rubrivivax benzoatilyticus JA2 = ATCC BAA-35]MCC9598911.1 succinate dehydrogenase, cytochrome b556 subunit [Rubrivivax sp. JA1055]MCC9648611.1 succinate dehydrogenase, cytochrome b556 subunit [Rubrivivax sp. JA1029]NHK97327.1 succinate dehydrogenase, cytochrome b556 subunit
MASTQRPVYRNIHISQIASYRLPLAGFVSILHRISGALMFVLLPFVIWLFDNSLTSEISFDTFTSAFVAGVGFVPAFLVKLVVLALIWAYLHHLIAGIRYLWMDVSHAYSKQSGRSSAIVTLALSLPLTALLGAKLFGLY